jgi:tocopherol cyclase
MRSCSVCAALPRCGLSAGTERLQSMGPLLQVRIRVWEARKRAAGGLPLLDCTSSGASGAVEVGGGPWWSAWKSEAAYSPPVRQLLSLPVDVEALSAMMPQQLWPPGL